MLEEQQTGQKYYPFLDGFRGFAILWVVLHHAHYHFVWEIFTSPLFVYLSRFAYVGIMGVDIFFVISGFLITGLLLEDFTGLFSPKDKVVLSFPGRKGLVLDFCNAKVSKSKIRLRRFYTRRFFKIAPQYFLTVVAAIVLTALTSALRYELNQKKVIIGHFFFLQDYSGFLTLLTHTWSLTIEERFYLLYPLFLALGCLVTKDQKLRRRIMITASLIGILVFNAVRYFYNDAHLMTSYFKIQNFIATTFDHMDALSFGCLLKFLEPYYQGKNSVAWKVLFFLFFVLGIGIFAGFIIFGLDWNHWYQVSLIYLAAGMLVLAAYKGYDWLVKWKWLIWIGKNSYGIYLWHYLLLLPFVSLAAQFERSEGMILTVSCLYITVSIAVGALSTITWERYFLNLRKKYFP